MNFQDQVKKTIKEEHLFASSDLLLLALSGGADSVAMLCVLLELGYKIEAVHCNFHLRGKEAMRDEQFVRQLCAGREVKLHVRHFDTRAYATMHHVSIEMAARSLRYAYFEELRVEREARYIVVGHHRDDNVETLLLNLIRGTGLHGLCGIRSVYGHLVRPLLNVCRKEILDYLKEEGQLYITDSTNLETNFTRNRIRLQLLPLMRGINPSVDVTLQQTIERLRDVSLLYDEAIVEGSKRITLPPHHMELCISIPALLKERAPKALMYEILYPYGFSPVLLSQLVEGLLSSVSGAVYETSEWTLLHNRDELLLRKKESSEKMLFFPKKVPFEGFLSVNETYSLLVKRMKREDLKEIP
ncbi:MAG: tRNA lysidine(34) synthetase TilS, partial [Bacteroidaceae bacterium]